MTRRYVSPTLESALKRFVCALHRAYPEIAARGLRPPEPGLFIGDVAGTHVRLVPGGRNVRLFVGAERSTRRNTYFRWGFDLFKKRSALRSAVEDDETRAVMWLTSAAIELERLES